MTAGPNGSSAPPPPIAVYVHWPYCERICPYCDFNVYKNREVDAAAWRAALIADLQAWAARTGPRRLQSLYFGGGTPSLCPPSIIEAVIETCLSLWPSDQAGAATSMSSDVISAPEITLEANPTDAERAHFQTLAALGINRLSLGVQSFDDAQLAFLGRNHDGDAAHRALDSALQAFKRVSFDLIYALPDESASAWRARLCEALAFGAGHLSVYQLTIEPGTAFERAVERNAFSPPSSDLGASLFEITQEETAVAGLPAYEISNHARPDEESRHNRAYWRGEDYVGVGPGAHGRLTQGGARVAFETVRAPADYLAKCRSDGDGVLLENPLSEEEAFIERLAMGLRAREGLVLDVKDWMRISDAATPLIEDNLCTYENGRFRATEPGRQVLNAVIAALLSD
ncbi:MAG: radical SAM family heme chaperone HemW [Pseudomonadota bacterium]